MTHKFNGTAIVTGASSGIGAAYAGRLARRGHDLVLVARNAARLDVLADNIRAETGRTVETLPADLTDPAAVARVAARIEGDAAVTLLVNNAGAGLMQGLAAASDAEIAGLIALNVTAPTQLAAAAVRAFTARGRGTIVNLASVVALAPTQFEGLYSATKAHVLALSESLSAHLAGTGVQVQAVLPGLTRTEFLEGSALSFDQFPPEMVMEVGDLVDAALLGLERGEAVTIPPLHDISGWEALVAARAAMAPGLSSREPALRYRA
ncbi:SDR family NAD(P)-dependent oxidoreductase [Sphingomonas canadensis]|uniref:SDR family NAD(P)-dependent oxidoreductase n=1 Tax=Sphingomonas canadensis TaxID=1219257 RepID=A0ABW3H4W2_9SPHN|nr:SDR family NAD(P)-dependent oxidoreductase [Sphingomonas canadensis]MCW3836123.1 SDR family NAD(P)-dependent oxidoreductase [Sphingomonas canadensis]